MTELTDEELTGIFDAWEKEYRANPDGFLTHEECQAMETATLAERQAITFKAYLRQIRNS